MALQKLTSAPDYATLPPCTTVANQAFVTQKNEASMKDKKRRAKLEQIVGYHAEALRLAGGISANQRRFIEVAAKYCNELEPDGWLAGGGSQVKNPEEEN